MPGMLRSLFARKPEEQTDRIEVLHLGVVYAVGLRRSATARRYTLRVRPASREAVLTMPERGSLRAARAFVLAHAGWIAQRLARLPTPIAFEHGALVPIRGVDHVIDHDPGSRAGARLEAQSDGTPRLTVGGDPGHVARRVADFLRREARRDLEAAALRHARAAGVTLKRISIKDTVSRWGSCSSTGALAFSWRLILAPPFVLDYLAAHEVAHRLEMNHSPRFWRNVAALSPDVERAEAWLNRHGPGLHRYG